MLAHIAAKRKTPARCAGGAAPAGLIRGARIRANKVVIYLGGRFEVAVIIALVMDAFSVGTAGLGICHLASEAVCKLKEVEWTEAQTPEALDDLVIYVEILKETVNTIFRSRQGFRPVLKPNLRLCLGSVRSLEALAKEPLPGLKPSDLSEASDRFVRSVKLLRSVVADAAIHRVLETQWEILQNLSTTLEAQSRTLNSIRQSVKSQGAVELGDDNEGEQTSASLFIRFFRTHEWPEPFDCNFPATVLCPDQDDPKESECAGLLDTGSPINLVSSTLVEKLGLFHCAKQLEPSKVKTYDVGNGEHVRPDRLITLHWKPTGHLKFVNTPEGTSFLVQESLPVELLLGRQFLLPETRKFEQEGEIRWPKDLAVFVPSGPKIKKPLGEKDLASLKQSSKREEEQKQNAKKNYHELQRIVQAGKQTQAPRPGSSMSMQPSQSQPGASRTVAATGPSAATAANTLEPSTSASRQGAATSRPTTKP
ncbi:retropepsin-like aspartic protease [Aspergillus mulundensis]|uniref:Uncharacterized protein n=1 Tax=Aspergillus mulundensis TaxID=1810919 RepID=A0A3D8QZR3_9EURO|nr:hypothetical protein DSM5745_09152 [Aspergillus mulundensis]RDW67286.1 hypothetical protein DSM5745_09152 [Aspergillus mulundensis]